MYVSHSLELAAIFVDLNITYFVTIFMKFIGPTITIRRLTIIQRDQHFRILFVERSIIAQAPLI